MSKTGGDCPPEYEEDTHLIEEKARTIADMIKKCKRIVAFTGAGISTSTGIPDYRGPTGKWTREAKGLKPVGGVSITAANPSYTHRALAALVANGIMTDVISQNTDGLHARSGVPLNRLWELHGNSWKSCCWKCDFEMMHDAPVHSIQRTGCAECLKRVPHFCHCTGQKCPKCGSMLKKSIINFGENLNPRILTEAQRAMDDAGLCLALGSSLRVTPAADIPESIVTHDGKLIIVNMQETPLDALAAVRVFGKVDFLMEAIMKNLGIEVPAGEAVTPTPAEVARATGIVAAAPKHHTTPMSAVSGVTSSIAKVSLSPTAMDKSAAAKTPSKIPSRSG